MLKVQKIFESLMRVKGHADFSMTNDRYNNASLQMRWNYFHMGWEMHEVTACPD